MECLLCICVLSLCSSRFHRHPRLPVSARVQSSAADVATRQRATCNFLALQKATTLVSLFPTAASASKHQQRLKQRHTKHGSLPAQACVGQALPHLVARVILPLPRSRIRCSGSRSPALCRRACSGSCPVEGECESESPSRGRLAFANLLFSLQLGPGECLDATVDVSFCACLFELVG